GRRPGHDAAGGRVDRKRAVPQWPGAPSPEDDRARASAATPLVTLSVPLRRGLRPCSARLLTSDLDGTMTLRNVRCLLRSASRGGVMAEHIAIEQGRPPWQPAEDTELVEVSTST